VPRERGNGDWPPPRLNDFDHLVLKYDVSAYRRAPSRESRGELLQSLGWMRGLGRFEALEARRLLREGRDREALSVLDALLERGSEEHSETA
jgi:hypothetical protein